MKGKGKNAYRLWATTKDSLPMLLNAYSSLEEAKDAASHVIRVDRDLGNEGSYYIFKGSKCLWYSGNHPQGMVKP